MLDLVVKCEKAREGCEWEGEIRSLDKHKSTCLHVPVPCPRECDVGSVLRGDLQSHLQDYCSQRDYECPHCHEMGRYRERVTSHLQDCPMVLTECPNEGCEQMLCSSLILFHVAADCPLTVLQCRYSEAGCKVQLPRRDLEEHEHNNRLHLQIVTKHSAALKDQVDKLTTTITSLENKMEKLMTKQIILTPKDNSITFKVTEYGKKKKDDVVFQSPSFYTSSTGYHMCCAVLPNGDREGNETLSVHAFMLKGEHDNKLSWPFVGEVIIVLLNQLEDKNHYESVLDVTPESDLRPGRYWGFPEFSTLEVTDKTILYLKDDTLYFRVSVNVHKAWLNCTV